ncbi:MAG: hypothetical protein PHX60_13545 [Giesbergeria sp.]|uniref:hypothetical protein n=1 Tax=Giesbergeria sp. TaxID=2818473 RepID=UPI002627D0A4|nr:hypothetical protein [Giesbergeria sp.]MDD2610684.1 hypothetical protein [Giesbergeria sp.]
MKTAHSRQSQAKRALRHADLPEFFYPGPPPDDRDEVDAPEPSKSQPQRPQKQGDAA